MKDMIAIKPNEMRLSKRSLNILFNLAEMVANKKIIEWDTILNTDHPLTYVHLKICNNIFDIDESFEYETIVDILTKSIVEGEEFGINYKLSLIKLLCENKEKYNIEINTELLITYLL